jgi:hypothetical protein
MSSDFYGIFSHFHDFFMEGGLYVMIVYVRHRILDDFGISVCDDDYMTRHGILDDFLVVVVADGVVDDVIGMIGDLFD